VFFYQNANLGQVIAKSEKVEFFGTPWVLPLRPRTIRCCSRLSSTKSPHIWCNHMDRRLCPLSFGRRKCRSPCGLRKMLILLLAVLLSWHCLLQLLNRVPCTGTWPGMVSLPSKIMPLLIGPFPNRFPVGPYPSLHGPNASPTKVLLRYLGSFRLPLLPCSSKLPLGPR